MNSIHKWLHADGDLSFDRLRMMYPGERFRVSRYIYPPGISFGGVTRKCIIFVLQGELWIRVSEEISCSKGDVVSFQGGKYEIRTSEKFDVELAFVWDLDEIAEVGQE